MDWAVFLSWWRLSSATSFRFLEITEGDQLLHGEGRALLDGGYRRQRVDGRALGGQAGRPQLAGWRPSVVERGAVVVELVEVLGAVG